MGVEVAGSWEDGKSKKKKTPGRNSERKGQANDGSGCDWGRG